MTTLILKFNRLTWELATATATLTDLAGQLDRALRVASNCNHHYTAAPPRIRRQINQGLFKAFYLHRDGEVANVELTEPFAQLLGDDLLPTLSTHTILTGQPDQQQDTATNAASRADQPAAVLRSATDDTPTHNTPQQNLLGRGLHNIPLVPPAGHHKDGNGRDQRVQAGTLVVEGGFEL